MNKLVVLLAGLLAVVTATSAAPLDREAARYEAQKLLAALEGQAQSAAFIDSVLQNDQQYRRLFTDGLKPLVADAPVADAAFAPYVSCSEAGKALLKFAELRKLAGRQSAESDKYRAPFWERLSQCKAAVNR